MLERTTISQKLNESLPNELQLNSKEQQITDAIVEVCVQNHVEMYNEVADNQVELLRLCSFRLLHSLLNAVILKYKKQIFFQTLGFVKE